MAELDFKPSAPLTLGVELELQLLDPHDFDLTIAAADLLRVTARAKHPGEIKPEITESMIEVSTDIQTRYLGVLDELKIIRDTLVKAASKLNVVVSGGGAHPFQRWSDRAIFDKPRYKEVSKLYGYLAKQFTVFGQHIHIGCENGDDAMLLLHSFAPYIPHFIALSASSPYYQGVDSSFDSSRLNAVFAFPLSGRAPWEMSWEGFTNYFEKMRVAGVVESMKDFYWDIRPKPEYGTIEIRVCDTPLTIERAAELTAYAQALARWLMRTRPFLDQDIYLPYTYNRFQACRFGLDGTVIVPGRSRVSLREHVIDTIDALAEDATALDSTQALANLRRVAESGRNDAVRLRAAFADHRSLPELMWEAGEWWAGR